MPAFSLWEAGFPAFGFRTSPKVRFVSDTTRPINDELMSPMTETIQCALTEKGLIENSHPFLDATIGRDDRGRSRVAFHNQVIEI